MHSSNLFSEDEAICTQYESDPDHFFGAIFPPTFENSVFVHSSHEDHVKAIKDERFHYSYWRGTNPTLDVVEKKLARLERGEQCKCFASGMAAIHAAILNSIQAGDHVLCISNIYKSTTNLLTYMKKFNVDHSVVYSTKTSDIEQAILPNTKLFFIENPTDLNFQLVDLSELANLAKSKGIRTIVDNTWATPLFQKPLLHGIDIVVHSASKYLGGHMDLVGGAIITSKEIMKDLFQYEYLLFGGSLGPREATLLLRGLKTLPLRMKAHQENAMKVATFLETHPAVEKVNYPGLPPVRDSELRTKQLSGFSGLMTFELRDANYEAIKRVINKVKVFKIGVSWGTFDSLILSPNVGDNEDALLKEKISPGLIRISVGLEPVQMLINDLNQALFEC
ncbi:trans-sulfuration enzyme family protein [Bacillus suaedaesalsae]|uniref:Aminotransferase class I/II-fold pyridoxal phosphate-dependent enzyme n=1 Tax=Bacillus suaedaesalsae TaxID=2810349 RepID=A0ABS2DGA2_9BACI|nr:aminotransferase class I/II-fold pyridoxal phosphate-dependent enzyme [Bacillus suaedaesalsae]MBM6616571.1 aminotransferase class I/II-fold pyridoxal phosphate-dependent enzyme [Bacillus suaedaesalsae]